MVSYNVKIFLSITACIMLSAWFYIQPTQSSGSGIMIEYATKLASIVFGFCAVALAIGWISNLCGFTKEDLEKIGDDAIEGKPPF